MVETRHASDSICYESIQNGYKKLNWFNSRINFLMKWFDSIHGSSDLNKLIRIDSWIKQKSFDFDSTHDSYDSNQ